MHARQAASCASRVEFPKTRAHPSRVARSAPTERLSPAIETKKPTKARYPPTQGKGRYWTNEAAFRAPKATRARPV